VLRSTPKDAERAAAKDKAAVEKKQFEANLLKKREAEIAAVVKEVKTKKDKASWSATRRTCESAPLRAARQAPGV
jgi:hypothetical protein